MRKDLFTSCYSWLKCLWIWPRGAYFWRKLLFCVNARATNKCLIYVLPIAMGGQYCVDMFSMTKTYWYHVIIVWTSLGQDLFFVENCWIWSKLLPKITCKYVFSLLFAALFNDRNVFYQKKNLFISSYNTLKCLCIWPRGAYFKRKLVFCVKARA